VLTFDMGVKNMKALSLTRLFANISFTVGLLVLAGCSAPSGAPTKNETLPTSSPGALASPTSAVLSVPSPIPTVRSPESDADYATKIAEDPRPTFEPTLTPARPVSWLVDLLRSSTAITITAWDVPDMNIPVNQGGRQLLAAAAESGTVATVSGDEWLSNFVPFPGYELQIEAPAPGETVKVMWVSKRFAVWWSKSPDDNNPLEAYYHQPDESLYYAISSLAPASHYPVASVRHLLHASAARVLVGGYDYNLEGENNHMIIAARLLADGTPAKGPAPLEEPMVTIVFTVDNTQYSVDIFENYFTYNGQTYHLEEVGPGVRASLFAD